MYEYYPILKNLFFKYGVTVSRNSKIIVPHDHAQPPV